MVCFAFLARLISLLKAYFVQDLDINKIKIDDPWIQSSIFNADGSIDFSINQKTSVQEISIFHVRIFD